jgi:uncharacterized membrane protein YidH (DUF202 family)
MTALQPQRTDLAWTRTSLAACGLALIALRLAFDEGGAAIAAALIGTFATGVFAVLARQRSTQLRADGAIPPPSERTVAMVTASLLVLDVAGLAFILG